MMTAIQNRPARQASTVAKALICTACDVGIVIIIMMAGGYYHYYTYGTGVMIRKGVGNRTAQLTKLVISSYWKQSSFSSFYLALIDRTWKTKGNKQPDEMDVLRWPLDGRWYRDLHYSLYKSRKRVLSQGLEGCRIKASSSLLNDDFLFLPRPCVCSKESGAYRFASSFAITRRLCSCLHVLFFLLDETVPYSATWQQQSLLLTWFRHCVVWMTSFIGPNMCWDAAAERGRECWRWEAEWNDEKELRCNGISSGNSGGRWSGTLGRENGSVPYQSQIDDYYRLLW